jgi:hypothetical protein
VMQQTGRARPMSNLYRSNRGSARSRTINPAYAPLSGMAGMPGLYATLRSGIALSIFAT